jgi:Protein of unknown function (DUF1569)
MAVKTKSVSGRRTLHFSSYDELLDEVRRLAARPTRHLGNWSLGQVCQHLAAAMNMAIDGPPFRPGLLLRLVGPLLKKWLISRPLRPGFNFPKTATVLIPQNSDVAAGVAAVEKAVARLQQNPQRKPHPVFGRMTREEWDQLQFRHAEMHLSFIVPEEPE